jgi:hypothetical protein
MSTSPTRHVAETRTVTAIIPVGPAAAAGPAVPGVVTVLFRRTFGLRYPSRRTFGYRFPSRRTFGVGHP